MATYSSPFIIGQAYRVLVDLSSGDVRTAGQPLWADPFTAGEIVVFEDETCSHVDAARSYYFRAPCEPVRRRIDIPIGCDPISMLAPILQVVDSPVPVRHRVSSQDETRYGEAAPVASFEGASISEAPASAVESLHAVLPRLTQQTGYVAGFATVCAMFLAPMLLVYAFTDLPVWLCVPLGLLAGLLQVALVIILAISRWRD